MRTPLLPLERAFWFKVYQRGDCWEWRGKINFGGYGAFMERDQPQLAHRYSFHQAKGPLLAEQILDHRCNHPWCVKPSHLVVTTDRENTLRGQGLSAKNARKTHCKRGHEFTRENTVGKGFRSCRICRRILDARYKREALAMREGPQGPYSGVEMPKGFKEARVRLWKRRPFCHWCGGGPLVLLEAPRRRGWRKRLATVDHLRSKLDPTRTEPSDGKSPRYVLACYDCNNRRGAEEYKSKVPLEEQWKRSGRAPWGSRRRAVAVSRLTEEPK